MSRAQAATHEPLSSRLPGRGSLSAASVEGERVDGHCRPRWTAAEQARLRRAFDEHFGFVWRYVRRLGLRDTDADDATQQVFVVLARRLGSVETGKERSFLCGTAVRVVCEHRRASVRRREVPGGELGEHADGGLRPDDLVDRERARALLDQVLEAMPIELRAVFVLFEIEEVPVSEIALLLDLPTGTAASRLRRARESFRSIVRRLRAQGTLPGENP